MRRHRLLLSLIVAAAIMAGAGYLFNASWLAPNLDGTPKLMAHRGVHQNFDRAGLTDETCTATRIREPILSEIENTIVAMQAAFDLGASVVELDVQPTTDGQFAVFHDWTLDCRTDGEGVTREHDMAYLKALDIGYGYTADGGRTFPLRGKGIGQMPSLGEVIAAFPNRQFLINFKSRDPAEGEMLAAMIADNPSWRLAIWGIYGGAEPTQSALAKVAGLRGFSTTSIKDCLVPYLLLGWTGHVPAACRDTIVPLPINYAGWMWGWPNRFVQRMHDAGSVVLLRGPYGGPDDSDGIDTIPYADAVPKGFPDYVWTNDIAEILPHLRQ
ncbi:MAG: glycerophosphodiester phosphodiesterase [Devosia sp.]|uniref:glycerophosphodiester phosphodiesterase family protein n=1 Tax=Devosia sp. TaxID=1871048 RepID=UPI00260F4FF0|nr:glycerophosphodiester phosphodiesterase family protein [Devosia sp.]MDB5586296.1 glycerophosphodiester phosphodiesterase [Devosia sp.]